MKPFCCILSSYKEVIMSNSAVFNFISLHKRFYASLEPIKEKVKKNSLFIFLLIAEKKTWFFFHDAYFLCTSKWGRWLDLSLSCVVPFCWSTYITFYTMMCEGNSAEIKNELWKRSNDLWDCQSFLSWLSCHCCSYGFCYFLKVFLWSRQRTDTRCFKPRQYMKMD